MMQATERQVTLCFSISAFCGSLGGAVNQPKNGVVAGSFPASRAEPILQGVGFLTMHAT